MSHVPLSIIVCPMVCMEHPFNCTRILLCMCVCVFLLLCVNTEKLMTMSINSFFTSFSLSFLFTHHLPFLPSFVSSPISFPFHSFILPFFFSWPLAHKPFLPRPATLTYQHPYSLIFYSDAQFSAAPPVAPTSFLYLIFLFPPSFLPFSPFLHFTLYVDFSTKQRREQNNKSEATKSLTNNNGSTACFITLPFHSSLSLHSSHSLTFHLPRSRLKHTPSLTTFLHPPFLPLHLPSLPYLTRAPQDKPTPNTSYSQKQHTRPKNNNTMVDPPVSIIIVGAGLGGLALAALLEHIDVTYVILERLTEVKTNGNTFTALDR